MADDLRKWLWGVPFRKVTTRAGISLQLFSVLFCGVEIMPLLLLFWSALSQACVIREGERVPVT